MKSCSVISRTPIRRFSLTEEEDDEIDKLIKEGDDLVKYLCSEAGKTVSGWEGFGLGIAGMFGLSGIKTLQAGNGRNATDFLKKANSILQQITQYYSLAFAGESVQLYQDLLTDITTSIQAVTANTELMNTILTEEDQLLQIQIYGVYLICAVIIFFLILLL